MRNIDRYDFEALANAVYYAGINLAESYEEWRDLRFWMAGGGTKLLDSFLLLASMSSKYNDAENRKLFLSDVGKSNDNLLMKFVALCKRNGIVTKDFRTQEAIEEAKQHWAYRYKQNYNKKSNAKTMETNISASNKPLCTIPGEYVSKSFCYNSSFMRSVVGAGLLTEDEAKEAARVFLLGASRKDAVIFWQIDEQGQVHEGKMMLYDARCHRIKEKHALSWVGYELRNQGKLHKSWKATHCLFGLHQIRQRPDDTICIVESEKTAVICSQKVKDCVWMATGGIGELNLEHLKTLQGHKLILYPDTDTTGETFDKWRNIAWQAKVALRMDIIVSDILEKNATPEQKEAKIDIADYVVEDELVDEDAAKGENIPQHDVHSNDSGPRLPEGSAIDKIHAVKEILEKSMNMAPSEMLCEMAADNPAVLGLVDRFGLVEVDSS